MATYVFQKLKAVGISDAAAHRIAPTLSLSSLRAEAPIWPSGNSPVAWRFVINGVVAAVVPVEGGGVEVQNLYGAEAWFGEQSIINASSSYVEYVCVTDVELVSMPATVFLRLLDEECSFAVRIARLISWRAQRDAETLLLIKAGNSALRAVIGVGMLFEAIAAKSDQPVTENMTDSLSLPVSQHVLARLCGVSRTSLWESMSKLEGAGWVKVHYGKVELFGLHAWRIVMRRRRESRSAKMNPTINELLKEFSHADMAKPNPAHMSLPMDGRVPASINR